MWAQVLQSRYRVEEDNWFDKLIEWRVGVGSKVRFWLDKWVGPTNLAVAFPRLFIMSDQQLASIAEIGAVVYGEWVWHLRWRRNRFEWEIPLEQQLLRQINSRIFNSSQCDSWSWVAESSGMFSVKSAYQIILAESVTIEVLILQVPHQVESKKCHKKLYTFLTIIKIFTSIQNNCC
uniref:Uncharacterized protein n=1 Tax=Cajanus cajan TaxID=3821 RepID=A0A151QYQ0_CAJCA|nr:hypothetical protein KK1_043519 [Cajanus cajan]